MPIFNRLFLKVYLTVIGTLSLAVLVSVVVWRTGPEMETARNAFEMASGVAAAALADPTAPPAEQQRAVERLSRLLSADLALYNADGTLLGAAGMKLPPPRDVDSWRSFGRGRGPVWSFRLADGRAIVVRPPFERHRHGPSFMLHLAIIALILAIGSYPVVRGLTRRLERLQQGVETLGAGNLSVRVKVEGKDEIARVAESFNRAAARIEALVNSHKMLLANASHELRTPLTRLRMGIELLKGNAEPQRRAELEQDIAELDELIEEILLSSRLDSMARPVHTEDVDLLALAAEEASRFDDITVTGQAVVIKGDTRLLRRLIRNLIDNAKRHGRPPIEVSVAAEGANANLTVTDHGSGIPGADREHVFEPFFRKASATSNSTGLGLALVRQIARHHGGDVSVEGNNTLLVRLPKSGI